VPVDSGSNDAGDELTVTGPDVDLTITAYNGANKVPLAIGAVLRTMPGGRIVIEGGTYSNTSAVSVYLFDSAIESVADAEGSVAATGRFVISLTVPLTARPGPYILQVNGYAVDGNARSINVGVTVEVMPWITASPLKTRAKVVTIGTSGLTGEIPAGAIVIPMIKYKGTNAWVTGTSRPTVSEDGTFTWQRKIARTAWIYFVWIDHGTMKPSEVRSNMLQHRQPLRT